MTTQQMDFLRFTDWKNNKFEMEDFQRFLSEFDIFQPDFLKWIEQNQASYVYFYFYCLLVKNYHNQQQDIPQILAFLLAQEPNARGAFISFIKYPQQKYPDILDLQQFEQCLIQHIQQYDLEKCFPEFESFFNACCLFYFRFQALPYYLCKHVTAPNHLLVSSLVQCGYWQDIDHGILDLLIVSFNQSQVSGIFSDLKNWAEKTKYSSVQEKIATFSRLTLQKILENDQPYYAENYIQAQDNRQAQSIEGYIDLLRYLPDQQTQILLSQIIENIHLHIAIRFEAVFIYFCINQQQHPIKAQLTQQLLTLSLSARWGKSSAYSGIINSYDLFKQTDFFTLDEILLALNSTQWCYTACEPLSHYSNEKDQQQKIIQAVIDATSAMIQRMLAVSAEDYVNAEYIGCLTNILKHYDLMTLQRQQLESLLLDGLQQFIAYFTEQKYLHKEMVEIIYGLGFSVPDEYFNLLGIWTKLEFAWQIKGREKADIWQQLIDAEVITQDAVLDSDEDFSSQFFSSLDLITYGNNDDTPFGYEVFQHYLKSPIQWLDEEDLSEISPNLFMEINREDTELEWKRIEYFYFKYNEQYYRFFIYDFMGRDSVNHLSFLTVFNQILKRFNSDKAIYRLEGAEDFFGENEVYFSVNQEKFDNLNQTLNIPCIKPIFFIPEAKSPQFLAIEFEFKQIVKAGGFIKASGFLSSFNKVFVKIPEPQSLVSSHAQKWLISMINEMRSRALPLRKHDDFFEHAINIRNLFVSLALNMIWDCGVVNELKKKHPLCSITSYQAEDLAQKQSVKLLDLIFNEKDLATHLQYPYS